MRPIDDLQPDHLLSGPAVTHRLFANEPAHGASPRALAAAREAVGLAGHYPDELASDLRIRLAAQLGVAPQTVSLANGSTAAIASIIEQAVLGTPGGPGGRVIGFEGSFRFYRDATLRCHGDFVAVPTPDGQRDVERLAAATTRDTRLVVVDDPGSPHGGRLPDGALEWLAGALPADALLLRDEAYRDFTAARECDAHHDALAPNVVVTRTFSKAFGLPGLRVGWSLAAPDLAQRLRAHRDRAQISTPALAGAAAALLDEAHVRRNIEAAIAGRTRLRTELAALGIDVPASETNYVLVPTNLSASEVVAELARRDIGVRDMTAYGLPRAIRVSASAPEAVEAFLDAAPTTPGLGR